MQIGDDIRKLSMVRSFVDNVNARLSVFKLKAEVGNNLHDWKELITSQPDSLGVSGALDPDRNDLRPGNSYWVYIQNDDGQKIACQADRLIDTRDFVREYILTNRLYGDREPSLYWKVQALEHDVPHLSGLLAYGGGTWVHPDWRGIKVYKAVGEAVSLGGIMSRLGRLMGIQNYWVDGFTGFMGPGRRFTGATGLSHHAKLVRGYYGGRDAAVDLDIFWMWRDEILSKIAEEVYAMEDGPSVAIGRTA